MKKDEYPVGEESYTNLEQHQTQKPDDGKEQIPLTSKRSICKVKQINNDNNNFDLKKTVSFSKKKTIFLYKKQKDPLNF